MNYFQKRDELLAEHLFMSMERMKAAKIEETSAKEIKEIETKLKNLDRVMEAVVRDCVYRSLVEGLGPYHSIGYDWMKQISSKAATMVMSEMNNEGLFKDA